VVTVVEEAVAVAVGIGACVKLPELLVERVVDEVERGECTDWSES